jgi:hypothetical protein
LVKLERSQEEVDYQYIPHTSLGATSRVANGVEYTREGPASAKNGRGNGETKTRDEESTKERDLVLSEVGVRALGCRRERVSKGMTYLET